MTSDTRRTAEDVAERLQGVNPLVQQNGYPPIVVVAYKIITTVAWIAFAATALEGTFLSPISGHRHHSIWEVNRQHPTPFSLEPIITSVYWGTLLFFQLFYIFSFYSSNTDVSGTAVALAPHFTIATLLNLLFIHLWTRSLLWWTLVVAVINFLNLTVAYMSLPLYKARAQSGELPPQSTLSDESVRAVDGIVERVRATSRSWASGGESPRFTFRLLQHYAVLAGPLAFSFVALYWVGAAALKVHGLPGRILANVAIWGIFAFGSFGLTTFGDWVLAWCLSVLATSLGVAQFFIHAIALQWIFAFTIMGLLFVGGVLVAVPSVVSRSTVEPDGERQPLLRG